MPYSHQVFVANQVFTDGQADQIEVNFRDHIHGQSSVAPVALNWPQSNKTDTFDVGISDNGIFFRCGTSQSSNMVARPLDVSSAGEEFGFGVLNDNSLALGVSSIGATGAVLVNSSLAQPIMRAGFRDWPVTPGEAGYFIQSSGFWLPYGFSGLHPVGMSDTVQSDANGTYVTAYLSGGYDAYLILAWEFNTFKSLDILNLRTRRSSQNSGTYDDEIARLSQIPGSDNAQFACAGLFNVSKQDGASDPFTILFCGYNSVSPTIETPLVSTVCGSADSSPVEQIMVQTSGGNAIAEGIVAVYGLKRYVTI